MPKDKGHPIQGVTNRHRPHPITATDGDAITGTITDIITMMTRVALLPEMPSEFIGVGVPER